MWQFRPLCAVLVEIETFFCDSIQEMYVIHFSRKTRIVCELEVLFALILKALYGRLYKVGFRSIENLGHLRPLIQST